MEKWLNIHGFTCYQVSDLGRIKSTKFNKSRILKPHKRRHGYLAVELNGRAYSIHRLVATAFLMNPDNKTDVNHKNGVKYDNCVDNLEWTTHAENMKHSFKIGCQNNVGSKHPRAILDEKDVMKIKEVLLSDNTWGVNQRLARQFGVTHFTISKIKTGNLWSHVK